MAFVTDFVPLSPLNSISRTLLFAKAEVMLGKEMAGAVGFEPTIHDTKNRCLTTWPRPNPVRRCNLAIKCLAINPVLALEPSKMWVICLVMRKIRIKRRLSSYLKDVFLLLSSRYHRF